MSKINEQMSVEKKGNIVTIKITLPEEGTLSASGKSEVFGSTHGNQPIGNGLVLGLNLYKKVVK